VIDRLEIDTTRFTYTARAAGPENGRRVLLLHGFPQTSWCWRSQLSALGDAGYRAVAPDLRGYSEGARPLEVEAYALAELVDDVVELADAMEMDTFDLVGHDWGGVLAWVVGASYPDRVRSLSVVSTPHPLSLRNILQGGDPTRTPRSGYMDAFAGPGAEARLLGEDGSGSGLRDLLAVSGRPADQTQEYVRVLTQPGAMTAALNWYRASEGEVLVDLPLVAVPTLYVWSTDDAALGRRAAEGTADYVIGLYDFEVLENVDHWIPESEPELLSKLLLRHLSVT
jgi:pimeloyl-ACP methyl ester carboxylesterase